MSRYGHATDNSKNEHDMVHALRRFSSGVPGVPARPNARRPCHSSNLPFDGCNGLRLNRNVAAQPAQPYDIGFATEPRDLPFCIIPMGLLSRGNCALSTDFSSQKLHRLPVSQRREGRRMFAIFFEQSLGFLNQSVVKHFRGAFINTCIKTRSIRMGAEPQDAEAPQRLATLLPQFSHRSLRGEAYLNRSNHLRNVIRVNPLRRRTIEPLQDAMQILCPAIFGALAQSFTELL